MKQRLWKSILSRFLVLTLIASVVAGAFGVSINFAHADTYDYVHDGVLYWSEFKSYISSLSPTTGQYASLASIYQQVEDSWNDPKFNVFIMADNSGNLTFMTAHNTESSWSWKINFYNQTPIQYFLQTRSGSSGNCYYNQHSYIHIKEDVVLSTNYGYTSGSFNCLSYRKTAATDLANENRSNYYYPTPYDVSAGSQIFVLHDVYDSSGEVLFHANISNGSYVPPVVSFSWLKFNIGDRWFITPQDQTWTYGLRNDGEGSYNAIYIGLIFEFQTEYDDTVFTDFTDYVSVPAVFVPGAQNVVDDTVYGFEITDFLDIGLSYIGYSWINRETENSSGEVINRQLLAEFEGEFSVKLTAQEEDSSLNEAWQQFNTYVTEYNTTHVIPEQLADSLFGLNGSKIYPCSVSVPVSVWNNSPDNEVPSFADVHTWQWWYSSLDDPGFNFDILDTVIVSYSATGDYSLVYYYDDSLTVSFQYVDDQSFKSILEEFDIIIIVPDSDGCLIGSSWWQNTLNSICNFLGVSSPSLLNSLAISGSSSEGVEYVSSRPAETAHVLQGFSIMTKRAIQRQQLFAFSDGITKIYKLMSDYVESEDNWKTSFLQWSSSIFFAVDSIDGRLSSIYNVINSWNFSDWFSDLSLKLEQIADNTSETEVTPWYLSLWLWVLEFKPSNDDFSASLIQYDNNWEEFPELPAPSSVPLLPTIGG